MSPATKVPAHPKGAAVGRRREEPDASTFAGRLAARIRLLREEAGLTVEQLAERVTRAGYKLSAPTLYHWESGHTQPQLNAIPALAKVLKLPITDLLPKK